MENKNKNILGMIFFAISILVFIYMLISPLNHLITNIDEFFTMTIVNLPFGHILHVAGGDFNPPFYYLLAKLAVKLLGTLGLGTLSTLKLVSIVPYLLLIIVSATKIRNEYGWLTAGLFALSVGVMSEFFVYFLTARMYSWAILFVVMAFIYFKDVITKADLKSWVLFTVFAILSAYTHYYAAISVACLYLVLLYNYFYTGEDDFKMWGLSILVVFVSYLPWISSLLHQIQAIGTASSIAPVDMGLIIQSLGVYGASGEVILSAISIVVLIIIGIIYYNQSGSDDTLRFYILSGIGVFVLTIIIGIVLSIMINPMLLLRFLLPAAAVLWLVISIMINQIEDKKLLLISLVLVALLLVTGVGHVLTSEPFNNDVLSEITQDNSSIVILTNPKSAIYFINIDNQCDLYCINQSYIYGENVNVMHKLFDFKDITQEEIADLASNNTDKNIYLITGGDADSYKNLKTDSVLKENRLEILKINSTT